MRFMFKKINQRLPLLLRKALENLGEKNYKLNFL